MRLRRDIEVYRNIRERKTVSLNLEERWKEYLAERKLQDEQDKLLRVNTDDSRKNEAKDLYLDETLNVMKDWLELKRPEMKLSAGQRESR